MNVNVPVYVAGLERGVRPMGDWSMSIMGACAMDGDMLSVVGASFCGDGDRACAVEILRGEALFFFEELGNMPFSDNGTAMDACFRPYIDNIIACAYGFFVMLYDDDGIALVS